LVRLGAQRLLLASKHSPLALVLGLSCHVADCLLPELNQTRVVMGNYQSAIAPCDAFGVEAKAMAGSAGSAKKG